MNLIDNAIIIANLQLKDNNCKLSIVNCKLSTWGFDIKWIKIK